MRARLLIEGARAEPDTMTTFISPFKCAVLSYLRLSLGNFSKPDDEHEHEEYKVRGGSKCWRDENYLGVLYAPELQVPLPPTVSLNWIGSADVLRGRRCPIQGPLGGNLPTPAIMIPQMLTPRRYSAWIAVLLLLGAAAFLHWFRHRPPRRVQLTTNSPLNPVTSGAISPNRQMLAYSDHDGVHLKNLLNGKFQTVSPASRGDGSLDWKVSAWFPESRRLLMNAITPDGKADLWIASTDGNAHLFIGNAFGWSVSPDGAWVAFTERDANGDEIWLLAADGQRRKAFQAARGNYLTRVQWSPNGKWLTYLRRPTNPLDYSASLEIRGLDGSPGSALVSDPRLSDFFWLPDGRVVYSIRQGPVCAFTVVRINLETGASQGKPQALPRWAGACMPAATAVAKGDSISYVDGPTKSTVLIMDVDAAGKPLSIAKRLTLSEGSDSPGSWLADNRTVVFQSTRTGQAEVFKQADPHEAAVQLTHEPGEKYWPRVTSDGAWILYQILPHVLPKGLSVVTYAEPRPLLRIRPWGGEPETLTQEPLVLSHRCARRVNLCLVSEMNATKDHLVFSALDFAKGKGREFATFPIDSPGNYSWDISGDGTRIGIAKWGNPQIQILSLAKGSVKSIPVKGWLRHQGLDWASDDQGFFVGTATPGGTALLHVNLQGEIRTVWRQEGGIRTSGIESTDGRRLAVIGWTPQYNLWLLEKR